MISQDTSTDTNESDGGTSPPPSLPNLEDSIICAEECNIPDKESLTIASSSSGTDNDPISSHPCFTILQGRKKAVRNKAYKISLIQNILTVKKEDFLHESYAHDDFVTEWYRIYSAYVKNPSKFNNIILARAICHFDLIQRKNESIQAKNGYPCEIAFFRGYMEEVRDALHVEAFAPSKIVKKKFTEHCGGVRVQDTIDLSSLTNSSFDANNCCSAHCRHRFCLPIGPTAL